MGVNERGPWGGQTEYDFTRRFVTRSISLIVAAALRAAKVAPEVKLPAKSYPAAYLGGTVSLSVS